MVLNSIVQYKEDDHGEVPVLCDGAPDWLAMLEGLRQHSDNSMGHDDAQFGDHDQSDHGDAALNVGRNA